jgi:CHAD domain-containing protein
MELTLLLTPVDAARLQRLPVIKAARSGRSRSQPVQIVWHDTLDRKLASQGLAMAEQRGNWRLERYRPNAAEPWPPATDHRLILEGNGQQALRLALTEFDDRTLADGLPEAITPVAAFSGRRTMFPLVIDGEIISITLVDGVLRAVAAEQPTTRLILEGPGPELRTLVLALAETLAITVPPHSLWAAALQLADGTVQEWQRRGAPDLPQEGISVRTAFLHIVGHLTDVALHLAPLVAANESDTDPVHQMRVAVRRARSAFALFPALPDNPAHGSAARGLRRLGQILGPARDWDVFMTETAPQVEAVLQEQPALHSLLRAGGRRRRAAHTSLLAYLDSPEFRTLCLELTCLAGADPPAEPEIAPPLSEFAADALRRRWKKLLNAGQALEDLDNQALHELRLKAKRLRYAAEFFAPLFPEKAASRFIRRLAVLQECLGLFNDATVAEGLLRELNARPGYAAGLVLGFTAARGARSRQKIATAWARFRRRDPFWT